MTARTSPARAVAAIAVTIVLWASAYPAIRVGLRAFSPGQLAAIRFLTASLVFAIYLGFKRPRMPRGARLVRISLAGVLGITLYNLLLNTGELTVTAGAASFLINCMPVFAALLATAFLGERLRIVGWLGIAVSFAGVAMIAIGDSRGLHFGRGSLLVLGAALCSATMGLLQKPLLRNYDPVALTACLMASGELFLLPYLPAALHVAMRQEARPALLAALFLGIGPAALGYLAWSIALESFTLSVTVSLLYLIPPVAVGISYVWIQEKTTLFTLFGGLVTIAGVVLLSRYGRPVAPAQAAVPAAR
jgi:drug/metabolite transporter (DMT)-like permease